jgi:hypothetical protein
VIQYRKRLKRHLICEKSDRNRVLAIDNHGLFPARPRRAIPCQQPFSPRASRSTSHFVVVVVVVLGGTRLNFHGFFHFIMVTQFFKNSLAVIQDYFKLFASGVECVCILFGACSISMIVISKLDCNTVEPRFYDIVRQRQMYRKIESYRKIETLYVVNRQIRQQGKYRKIEDYRKIEVRKIEALLYRAWTRGWRGPGTVSHT